MAQLSWSLASQDDVVEIGDFIAKDSIVYAVSVVERLVSAAEALRSSPFVGRVVPEYGRQDLRELIIGSYRLVYLVRADEAIVVRVVSRGERLSQGPGARAVAETVNLLER